MGDAYIGFSVRAFFVKGNDTADALEHILCSVPVHAGQFGGLVNADSVAPLEQNPNQ